MTESQDRCAPRRNCRVSVVIVSLSGRDELFRACDSAAAQTLAEKEILVFIDQNDQARQSVLRSRFPELRLIPVDRRRSYITYRNQGFREANGEVVVWLDDDAYFSDSATLEEIAAGFEADECIAAIAIKYVEPCLGRQPRLRQRSLSKGTKVSGFVGCAAAFRKSHIQNLGGLRELYFAYGEERDLALRIYSNNLTIAYLDAEPVVHMVSGIRNRTVQNSYAVRNTILFDFLNVPFPDIIAKLSSDSFKLFLHRLTWRSAIARMQYVLWGFASGIRYWRLRRAATRSVYRRWRSLPQAGATLVRESELPMPVQVRRGPGESLRVDAAKRAEECNHG